jgi:hypothetical protein
MPRGLVKEMAAGSSMEAVIGSIGSVSTYDLAQIVDAIGKCGARGWRPERHRGGARNVNGGEAAAAEQEGVKSVVLVRVPADDLACVIDTLWNGDAVDRGGQRIVEGGVSAAAAWIVEKAGMPPRMSWYLPTTWPASLMAAAWVLPAMATGSSRMTEKPPLDTKPWSPLSSVKDPTICPLALMPKASVLLPEGLARMV